MFFFSRKNGIVNYGKRHTARNMAKAKCPEHVWRKAVYLAAKLNNFVGRN